MTVFILDPCAYTRCALKSSLGANGVKGSIRTLDSLTALKKKCQTSSPSVVFINQNYFQVQHDNEELKSVIDQHPATLFFIFIGNESIKFYDFVPIKNNVIITSKFIKISTINMIIRYFMDIKSWRDDKETIGFAPLRFSKTEAEILTMWMSGYDTFHICSHLHIKEKTLSSHKINIKRKTRASNKQVIYHLITIANSVTEGINHHWQKPVGFTNTATYPLQSA
ncbi:transcriptional regulator RcsA [Martelella alba]|nr:transcriptional regulator RcsA [Martelella alba]